MTFDKKLEELRARKAAAKTAKKDAVEDLRDALAASDVLKQLGFALAINDGLLVVSQGLYSIYVEWDANRFVINDESQSDFGGLPGDAKFAKTLNDALEVIAELIDENEN